MQEPRADFKKSMQVSVNSREKKQTVEQRQRAAAMVQYEEDRARQKERAARERSQRGDTVAATPVDPKRQSNVARPSVCAVTNAKNLRRQVHCTEAAAVVPPEAASGPEVPRSGSEDEKQGEKDDSMEEEEVAEGEEEEEEEEPPVDGRRGISGAGVRRRFPGQGNRLGGA